MPPPPVPTTPVARSLDSAYHAILNAPDPGAAVRAQALYAQARQRAATGDASGALAAAASAAAAANARGVTTIAPVSPGFGTAPAQLPAGAFPGPSAFAPTGAVPNARPLLASGDDLLPANLTVASNEIALAQRRTGDPLVAAKRRYRRALDAYLSGNAKRSAADARAAFDAAAAVLARVK